MSSIRKHLLTRLLPVFTIIWVAAGCAIYFSVRSSIESDLENDLREIVGVLPFGPNPNQGSFLNLNDIATGDVGIYFQIWGKQGSRILKSHSLGQFELEKPDTFKPNGEFGDQTIGSGDLIKTLAIPISDPKGLGDINLVVAKSREESKHRLSSILWAIIILGLIGAIMFGALLIITLNAGLRPLESIGNHAVKITGDTIAERFPDNNVPKELKPIVASLNELLSRLQLSLEREQRFSDDLAHEIRNPVAAIKSISEASLCWPDEIDEEGFSEIFQLSEQLEATTENMLTLARIEKRRHKLQSVDFNLRELVEEIWKLHKANAEIRNITIKIEIPSQYQVKTDPNLFRILISNLISNAVAYTPEGDIFTISAFPPGLNLTVQNKAPFLKKTDIPMLFDRLWRHDTSRTDGNHSGLGLSVAKACADALGLDLNSDLDGKHVITFSIRQSEIGN